MSNNASRNHQTRGTVRASVVDADHYRGAFQDTPEENSLVTMRFLQQYNYAWVLPPPGGQVIPSGVETVLEFVPNEVGPVTYNLSTLSSTPPYDEVNYRFTPPNVGDALVDPALWPDGRQFFMRTDCHISFPSAGVGICRILLNRADGARMFEKRMDCGPTVTDLSVSVLVPAPDDGIINAPPFNSYQWVIEQTTGGPVTIERSAMFQEALNSITYYTNYHVLSLPPGP